MEEAFVYCWTDKLTEKLYIGAHKGTSDDGYVCSSRTVKEEYTKRPQDFSRVILASGSWIDMFQLESSLLSACGVGKNPHFYNQCTNHGPFYSKGTPTTETKKLIGDFHRGKHKTEEHKEKISRALAGKKNALGVKRTAEQNAARSEFMRGNKHCVGRISSEKQKVAASKASLGRKKSPESIAKYIESRRRNKIRPLIIDSDVPVL